jgi:hypothetical protein
MNALTSFAPSACWRETSPTVWRYVLGGETLGIVQRIGDDYFAEADRRRDGRPLHLGRLPSKLAAMATVQDAIIGPSSLAATLGREAIQTKLPDDYQSGFTSCAGA